MKKFLLHPITIAVFSGLIITPIGNAIYDHTKNIPILTNYILKPLSVIWNDISLVANYKISIGIFLLIFIGFLAAIIFLIWFLLRKEEKEKERKIIKEIAFKSIPEMSLEIEPEFLNYKKDVLRKWLWQWDYGFNSKENYVILNLKALCDEDETPLVLCFANRRSYYGCPRCGKHFGDSGILNGFSSLERDIDANVLIADNIKKKFNQVVYF